MSSAIVSYDLVSTGLSMSNTASSIISIILSGTIVPLPTTNYIKGFVNNSSIFTVLNKGSYFISYNVSLTTSLALSSAIYINNVPENILTKGGLTTNNFSATAILDLEANDNVKLMLYGLIGLGTLQSGAGASLNIVRIG